MSKIYTDLNTVLTPYATAIKKNASDITSLNGSLGDVKADLDALEPGLSDEAKEALLACFKHVAWIDDDGQTYYEALEETLNRSHIISSISAVFNQGSTVVYDTDELYSLKQYLTVTATYDDGTTKEVNDYTLNGELVSGTSTITVAYNKKTTTFNVTVTHQAKTIESITATLSSSAAMTTDNVLDDLRPYLTVRATYSDGSTQTVSNYILNGSLNVGVNTITVTYSGKTATFNVVVTERITPSDVLYSLPSATTFNGKSTYIDTGLQLMKSEKSNITIVFDAIDNHPVGQSAVILHCMHENDPYPGICIQEWDDSGRLYAFDVNSNSASGIIRFQLHSTNIGVRVKVVMIIDFTSKRSKVIANIGGTDYTRAAQLLSDVNDVNISENALLGCYQDTSGTKGRYWKGTIYDFKIYDYAWTDTEAQAYLQEEHS